jgi:aminopeptidase N
LILAELNSDFATISELSRSQLIDDYFTLATEKYIEIETALQFTKYIAAEPKIVVWNTLLKHFRVLFNKLRGNSAAMDDFRQYILPKIEGGLTTVGKEQPPGEKGWKVNLRAQLLDWACSLGQTECRNYATRLFTAWNGAPETNPVPVDIKSVVFCNAVSAGGPDAYAIVKQRYVEAKDKLAANRTDEDSRRLKSAMLSSLGCVDEPGVLAALLEDVMAPPATSFLAQSDKVPLLESLAANSQTRPFVIELLREKLRDIFAFEGVTPAQIARIMTAFGTYVGTQQEHDDIVELVEPFATEWGTSINTARTALSNIGLNIKWRSEYDQRLKEWFSANK